MNTITDSTCPECGGKHEPSGARSDCIRHWKHRANELRQQLAGAQAEIEKYHLREWAAYLALGYSPPVSDALPHLIECMMGLKAGLQDSLDSIEKATRFQPGTEPLADWVKRKIDERRAFQSACDKMRQQRDEAQKDAAENQDWINSLCEQLCKMEDALGFKHDCYDKDGKWIPTIGPWLERVRDLVAAEGELGDAKEQRDEAQKACAEMRDVLQQQRSLIVYSGRQNVEERSMRMIDHALSTDCGEDFVPRAELDRLKAAARAKELGL